LRLDELGGKSGEAIHVSFRPAVLDRNGLTLDPAQLAQTSVEPQFRGPRWGAAVSEISNPRDPSGLRLARDRHKSETEHQHDREPDPPHRHLGGDGWRESSRTRTTNTSAGRLLRDAGPFVGQEISPGSG